MTDTFRRLYAHLRWADGRTIESYRTLPAPHPPALAWIAHIAGAEHLWLSRIAGAEPRVAVWPAMDIDACERLTGENHAAFDALIGALDDAAAERVVRYVNSRGDAFQSPVADILLHVAMHGQYHRGQVAAAVRAQGGAPLATDYIVWQRGAPAP